MQAGMADVSRSLKGLVHSVKRSEINVFFSWIRIWLSSFERLCFHPILIYDLHTDISMTNDLI